MGTFILISTPIGNVGDITLRARDALFSVDILLCEDTRETRKLLDAYRDQVSDTHEPLSLSYNDHNREERIPQVIAFLLQGKTVGLVTDRGTPLLSDPGYKLMQAVIALQKEYPGIRIDTLPGASALLPALQLSGFPPDKFFYIGFLPKKDKARKELLASLPHTTIVAYESPHRLTQTVEDIFSVLGNVDVVVARELTKKYQEVIRKPAGEMVVFLKDHPVKGEVVILFSNAKQDD